MTEQKQPFDAMSEFLFSDIQAPEQPNLKRPLEICPVCGSQTKWSGVDLICDSPSCIGQLIKQVTYFYSKTGFDLRSIAENMITQLILDKDVFKVLSLHPWALLDPESFNLIPSLQRIWGPKRTENYLTGLASINGRKNSAHFIASMGYPGLAYKTALKIFYFIYDNIVNSHIPAKAQQNFLLAYIKFNEIQPLLPNFSFAPLPESPQVVYCITGTLATPRVEIIDHLTKIRWEWSNQVSKFIDYLIVGSDPGKTKLTKAKQLGITLMTEAEFMEKIK